MSKASTTDQDAVRRLKDALVKDILEESDEQIAADAAEDGIDLERQAQAMRAMFEAEVVQAGKVKLQAAKAAVAAQRLVLVQRRAVGPASGEFAAGAANDVGSALTLTMAARNGGTQSERDLEGVKEDLTELAALQENGEKKS